MPRDKPTGPQRPRPTSNGLCRRYVGPSQLPHYQSPRPPHRVHLASLSQPRNRTHPPRGTTHEHAVLSPQVPGRRPVHQSPPGRLLSHGGLSSLGRQILTPAARRHIRVLGAGGVFGASDGDGAGRTEPVWVRDR